MATISPPECGKNWLDPVTGISFIWIEAIDAWVSKYQVTNQQYRLAVPEHDSGSFREISLNGERQPACCLSYEDAMSWCDWLAKELHTKHDLKLAQHLRLPSSVEWQTYAKCGDGRIYPWGDEWPPTRGNYACESAHEMFSDWDHIEGYRSGHAVSCNVQDSGRNEWGLYGVGGNCYEWTFEADGTSVQLRGASWSTCQEPYLRIDNCYRREPKSRLLNFAFRPVMAQP